MPSNATEVAPILWRPDAQRIAASRMTGFATASGFAPEDYSALHAWSINDPEGFHARLWDELDIIGERGSRILEPADDLRQVRFFPDARLNYAENVLRDADDRLALIAHRDDGMRRTVTRRELADLVSRIVAALRAEEIGEGDRVAGIVTNDIESIAFYLATLAIGAIWASCSPDFGPQGAADRLGQIEPALLVAVPSYTYAGKTFDVTASIEAVAATHSVRRIILLGEPRDLYARPAQSLADWIAPFAPGPIDFARLPFDAPAVILFSSGTTGRPKGIVHRGGGLLLQHKKEHALHGDIRPGDVFFYYTTCGWMMWNWLITGLALGATLVTYDGNPAYPGPTRMFDLIDAEGITAFGTSARFIDSISRAGLLPRQTHSLTSLRTVFSTGSPLAPGGFAHVYRDWKSDLHLASISGGTDICGCFLGGNPNLPVHAGELQCAQLGMNVAAYDPAGEAVLNTPGELVCRNAHISMPAAFWNDVGGRRYREAYFSRFPDIWAHGDFVEEHETGGFVILGRSDATLNPGGVRIGTAEIYRQLEGFVGIADAVAVGQSFEGDERIVLFVCMRDGTILDDELREAIRRRIRLGATPRHVPARIVAVPEIPRTRSGKISEIAVREAIHGRLLGNETALANPECLAAFRDLPELGK